jgi:hypothetical protein
MQLRPQQSAAASVMPGRKDSLNQEHRLDSSGRARIRKTISDNHVRENIHGYAGAERSAVGAPIAAYGSPLVF